jgi:uncharacterized glyoxalase superfamily protein PhnB
MHTVTPQLVVDGAAEAIELYKKAFGATEINKAPDPTGTKIWHAALKIGDSVIFINDAFPEMGGGANNSRIWLYVEKCDDWFARATAAGMKAVTAPRDMFWGDRIAQVSDKWNNGWTLATHVKHLTPEEMDKAQADFVDKLKKA